MTIAKGDWKLSEKIPYPLFVNQEAIFIEDAKGHPIALVDVKIANLLKAAPKMLEALKPIANMEQPAGKSCSFCGGYLDHREGCIFVLAEQTLAEGKQ